MLESIVKQTLLFAAMKSADFELLAFIGLNIAMGLLKLPQLKYYWYTDDIVFTPWFPAIMPEIDFSLSCGIYT